MPAFSLLNSPQLFTVLLLPVKNAPLPMCSHHDMLAVLRLFLWNLGSATQNRPFTHPLTSHEDYTSRSFGTMLSPVEFSAQSHLTSELLRTL